MDFVRTTSPKTFSYVRTADDEVHGHHASGLLIVPDNAYFSKNQFISDTRYQSFALTFGVADRIAQSIGMDKAERFAISLAFKDDALNVANHIVAKDLEVYA